MKIITNLTSVVPKVRAWINQLIVKTLKLVAILAIGAAFGAYHMHQYDMQQASKTQEIVSKALQSVQTANAASPKLQAR